MSDSRGPLDDALDDLVRERQRTVSRDELLASGRTRFRLIRRSDLSEAVSGLVEGLTAARVADVEREFVERLETREAEALAEGRDGVLATLVDLADLVDGVAAAADDGPGRSAAKALDRRLDRLFRTHGYDRVETVGRPFDAEVHEAVDEEPADVPPGTVVRELARGYRRDGFVLRVARVVVAVEE